MKLHDVLHEVRRLVQEPTADPNGFYADRNLRRYIKRAERQIAQQVEMPFETTRTFTTTASTQEYLLSTNVGPDTFGIYHMTYDGSDIVSIIEEKDVYHKSTASGKPTAWYIRGAYLGFDMQTATSGLTVKVFTHRMPPHYLFSINHDGTGSVTAATISKSGTTLTLTATDSTGTTTTTIDLTAAANDTISELISVINAVTGFTATISDEIKSTEASTNIANFWDAQGAVFTEACLNTRVYMVAELDTPSDLSELLITGALVWAYREDQQFELAGGHEQAWDRLLADAKSRYRRQKRGYNFISVAPPASLNARPLGQGGYVILS